jgi:hypothetical protein
MPFAKQGGPTLLRAGILEGFNLRIAAKHKRLVPAGPLAAA